MKHVFMTFVILSTSCAQMFPASSREIAPNTYQLTATGNSFASFSSLKAKIDKKAMKICGEDNFVYQDDAKLSTGKSTTYNNGIATSAGYIQINRIIKCKP